MQRAQPGFRDFITSGGKLVSVKVCNQTKGKQLVGLSQGLWRWAKNFSAA